MTFDPHIIRKTYKVTVEREINVAASAKRILATVKRHLKRRLRLRSLGEANAFVRRSERVRTRRRTRSNSETNAFASGGERVRTRRRTRLHANANARLLYLASERYCIYKLFTQRDSLNIIF